MMTYANIQDRIEQFLQDTANATFDTTELGMWIEEGLKEISEVDPHIFEVIFKIESRTGTDTAGTASSLTDTTKSQFVAGDATNEKVVHNTTDNTWAVVLANSSTSVNTLSANIMATNENYEIYNKRCRNEKQIYIGDMPSYLRVSFVEYPIGTRRNFKYYGDDVLEIDKSSVPDSDSTIDPPNDIDVLVGFEVPHVLSQLTDWTGEIVTSASSGATTASTDGLGNTEIIEVGEEFHVENHRSLYKITTEVTTSGNAATLTFFPALEAACSDNDDITFTKSTLKPVHENILLDLVCGTALMSDSMSRINAINKGGAEVFNRYYQVGERMVERARRKLKSLIDVDLRSNYIYSKS